MGIHDKIFILSGNIGDDWYSSYGIDYRMRIYFFYKFRSNRCIHADIHAKAFRLFRHCHNGVFHFLFSGSFTCRQELPSQLICAFTEYRAVASLFQDDRGLKSADPPACYKDRLRLICLNDLGILAFEPIIAPLVAAYAVINIVYIPGLGLAAEFRIGQLRPSHNNHIHLVFFKDTLCQLRGIDTSYPHRKHSGCLPYFSGVFNIKRLRYIDGRHLVFQTC